jgi:hypothetical protein
MAKYLGEFEVNIDETYYKGFTQAQWAMTFIEMYGGIDGAHHKDWVLDQVARILKGSKVEVVEARWDDGQKEFCINVPTPSDEYIRWVEAMKGETYGDGSREYDYYEGIAP